MNTWMITTRRGGQVYVTNQNGWRDFLLNLTLSNAVVAEGVYVPIGEIDSIVPVEVTPGVPAAKSMAEVIHLVPPSKPEPPGAA